MSKQYVTCEHCGANLDSGEQCDCKKMKYKIGQHFYTEEHGIVEIISIDIIKNEYICECVVYGEVYTAPFTEDELEGNEI